jgi:ATP-binding cassette, subfamily B, bacterial
MAEAPAICSPTGGQTTVRSDQSEPILFWIWRYLRSYGDRVIVLGGLSLAEVGLRVLTPWPLKAILDHVLGSVPPPLWLASLMTMAAPALAFAGGAREQLLIVVVIGGLGVQLAHQVVIMLHTRLSSATGHRMVRDLRERLFAHLQALQLSEHARTPTGDAIYRLETDAACLEHLIMRGLFPVVFSVLTLITMFIVLAGIDLTLAVVALGIAPVLFLWLRFYTARMRPSARRAKELESALAQRLHESMSAIGLVKTYAREDFEQQRFTRAADRALDARVSSARQEAVFSAVVGALTIVGTAAVVVTGGFSVLHGRISLGTLILLTAYLGFVYGPLCGIAHTTGALQHAVASARRVRDTFALATEPIGGCGGLDASGLRGHIEFDRISFRYENGARVLDGLSFVAVPGQLVALVGLSGAGKTTAVSLITRLYQPTEGRILIDGIDILQYDLRSLRRRIGVVLQETPVMSGSVRENLMYGRLDATEEEMIAAARAAHAHDFIMAQPQGYDTVLGEMGKGLSGGQRQRLSVARAFLKDAPILILDEPTAALDSISEDLVFDGLRRLQAGRTTFVIAHRLSTVRAADRILVLDHGRVVAEGTHAELVTTSALYARLTQQLTRERSVA